MIKKVDETMFDKLDNGGKRLAIYTFFHKDEKEQIATTLAIIQRLQKLMKEKKRGQKRHADVNHAFVLGCPF